MLSAVPEQIEKLYEPSSPPSRIKSVDIKENQFDDTYYSPCGNTFILIAHCLAFQTLEKIKSDKLCDQIETTYLDLKAAISGKEPNGYCSQNNLKEGGVTALLTANISKCFLEFCRYHHRDKIEERVSIMHQSTVGNGDMDIGLFYRFFPKDENVNFKSLFPFVFIEFMKTSNKGIESKYPQAALYANNLFHLMKYDKFRTSVPLLGIVMSDVEMLYRVYSLTVVDNQWRVAEVDVMRCAISAQSFERLLHIMLGWTQYCSEFLCSPLVVSSRTPLDDRVLLHKHGNIVLLDKKMYKCFDYRQLSAKSYVDPTQRRKPEMYFRSDLTGVKLVVDWNSEDNLLDSLKIISYDLVPGFHHPSHVGHIINVLRKIAKLHAENIVHGDLRFSNIVFSESYKAVIIDFDYSGLAGEQIYPLRFNRDIKDGLRHIGAREGDFLRVEHDIAAVQWMCAQYQPKNNKLMDTWSSFVENLKDGTPILDIIPRLEEYSHEELEPVE